MKRRRVGGKRPVSWRSNETRKVIRYVDCRKNHAARAGGYVLDGCREFMASGDEGSGEGYVCAACGCHRNFHAKVVEVSCECSS